MRFCARKKYVLPNGSTLFTCARSKGLLTRFVSDTQSTVQFIGEPLLTLRMKTRVSCLETPAERWPSAVESTTNQTLVSFRQHAGTTAFHYRFERFRELYNYIGLTFVHISLFSKDDRIEIPLFLKDSGGGTQEEKTFEKTMKLVCTNFFSNFQVGEFSIVFYFL